MVAGQTAVGQDISLTRSVDQGIQGHVYEEGGGSPMFAAHVWLYDGVGVYANAIRSYTTNATGSYAFEDLDPGTYVIEVFDQYDAYYFREERTVTLAAGQLRTEDFGLVGKATQGVSGYVVETLTGDSLGGVIAGVRDSAGVGYLVEGTAVTSAGGSFAVTGLPGGHALAGREQAGLRGQDRVVHRDPGRHHDARQRGAQARRRTEHAVAARSVHPLVEGVAQPNGVPYPNGTYEFWYRPMAEYGTEYGTTVAEITRDYPDLASETTAPPAVDADHLPGGRVGYAGSHVPRLHVHPR